MSERAISLTKQADGSYQAERDGRRITVPVSQRFGVDSIDRARAEYEANEALSDSEVARIDQQQPSDPRTAYPANSGPEDPVDRARVDQEAVEIYAVLVRWKVAAYDRLLTDAGRRPPAALIRKRDHWVSEQQRLGRADASHSR